LFSSSPNIDFVVVVVVVVVVVFLWRGGEAAEGCIASTKK
jgi:hypothetical protein